MLRSLSSYGCRTLLALATLVVAACGTLEPGGTASTASFEEGIATGARRPPAPPAVVPPAVAAADADRELDALDLALARPPRDAAQGSLAATPALTRDPARPDASPAASGDLWDRIRAGFAMPAMDSPVLDQRIRGYLARPDDLVRMFQRGAKYLHFIVEEIDRRGLPMELALLPFVESAMNPVALSPARAAGLWQFIPATGRRFELSQDWWVDERRDVVDSTRAALDYLQEVHAMHGRDWFLALASYNWGEYAVARAVQANQRRGRPATYEHLKMPNETANYVPKLLALRHIVTNATELGIRLPPIPDTPYFVTIEHPVPMDVKLAARFADMSVDDFVALNPAHNRPVIAASRFDGIRLPVDRVARFKAAAQRHAQQQRPFVTWRPHTLRPGETVQSLAEQGGVGEAEIRQANGLPAGRTLATGSRILVPAGNVVDASYTETFEAAHLVFHPPPKGVRRSGRYGTPVGASGPTRAAQARANPTRTVPARTIPARTIPSRPRGATKR